MGTFTDAGDLVVVNQLDRPVVLLCGELYKQEEGLVTNPHHLIIESAHPSPLSIIGDLNSSLFPRLIHS